MPTKLIKNWSLKHEAVVQMRLAGWPVPDIAKECRYSKVRVSQILGDPKAKLVVAETIERLRRKSEEQLEGKIIALSGDALDRLGETIRHEDFLLGSDAKKHQDNLSLGFLRGAGVLNGMENGARDTVEKKAPIDASLSKRLVEALEESNKADKLRILKVREDAKEKEEIDEQIKEADFEIVEVK